MNIEIRKEKVQDLNDINSAIELSFGKNSESKLVHRLRQTNCLTLSLVACINSKIVGHIAFSPVSIRGSQNDIQSDIYLGLAPLAVIPEYQRQGIGSKLVIEGINQLRKQNVKAIFVLGNDLFYSRFGFVPSFSRFGIKSNYKVDDKYFMALELFENSLNNISGNLSYCKAFDDL